MPRQGGVRCLCCPSMDRHVDTPCLLLLRPEQMLFCQPFIQWAITICSIVRDSSQHDQHASRHRATGKPQRASVGSCLCHVKKSCHETDFFPPL